MAKPELKERARRLRAQGGSMKGIAAELGVSSGSVHRWCRDIVLTQEQVRILAEPNQIAGTAKVVELGARRRKEDERIGKGLIGELSERDLLLLGIGLYWGEGFKTGGQVGISNMDPALLRSF